MAASPPPSYSAAIATLPRAPRRCGGCVSAVGAGEAVEERGASSCAPVMIQVGSGVTIQVLGDIRAERAGL